MAQISQNADGTYSKSYSDTEIAIINVLQDEITARKSGDNELWVQTTILENRLVELEDTELNLASLQNAITKNMTTLVGHEDRIKYLEDSHIVDAYSKTEVDSYLAEWKVEQIPHVFDIPTNTMFDRANLDDIRNGYAHFKHADIHETNDHHFPENTMRRYTIWAFASTPKQVTFRIQYADRAVVYIDGVAVATYIDAGGNFEGAAKVLIVDLKEGWTRIQFLVANETQQGGLVIVSDLYEKADYLSNLDYMSGMITGERLQAGTLDERHFSPNMDLVVHTLHATASDVPGVIVGDPNGCGILQIGDSTIMKCKDEPFVFDDGIRVNGFIRVSQLLIDVDFIRAGKGMIVDAVKDADTGFTKMYEIINDVRINNGGGLVIIGNGQEGFTLTNDLRLIGNPEGGISVAGDAVKGYIITNTMILSQKGGLEITGDATHGYYLKNTMELSASPGLKVEGNASDPGGYNLKNQMLMTTNGGVKLTPTIVNVDAYKEWRVDLTLEAGDAIDIRKIQDGYFRVTNTLQITNLNPAGSIAITGNIKDGYKFEGFWPRIEDGHGIRVDTIGNGYFVINNTGVVNISAGLGIDITNSGNGNYNVRNSGVISLIGSGAANVYNLGNGSYQVDVVAPPPEPFMFGVPQVPVAFGGDIFYADNIAERQFGSTNSGGTAGEQGRLGYYAGFLPSTADCVIFVCQAGVESIGATAEIRVELSVMEPAGRPNTNVTGVYTSSTLISNGDGNNFNMTLLRMNVGTSDAPRHWDARVFLRRSGGSGRVLGKIRECWSDRMSNRVAHGGDYPVQNA